MAVRLHRHIGWIMLGKKLSAYESTKLGLFHISKVITPVSHCQFKCFVQDISFLILQKVVSKLIEIHLTRYKLYCKNQLKFTTQFFLRKGQSAQTNNAFTNPLPTRGQ